MRRLKSPHYYGTYVQPQSDGAVFIYQLAAIASASNTALKVSLDLARL